MPQNAASQEGGSLPDLVPTQEDVPLQTVRSGNPADDSMSDLDTDQQVIASDCASAIKSFSRTNPGTLASAPSTEAEYVACGRLTS